MFGGGLFWVAIRSGVIYFFCNVVLLLDYFFSLFYECSDGGVNQGAGPSTHHPSSHS